jgi:hypothetical protein
VPRQTRAAYRTRSRPTPLSDYAGVYDNPAYGPITVAFKDNELHFDFHKIKLPLMHYHYDRFDTPDDEQNGKWSVNFRTNPQGDIDQAVMSLDEAEAVFVPKPAAIDPSLITQFLGAYTLPGGGKVEITRTQGGGLAIAVPGQPPMPLIQVKDYRFRTPQFSDEIFEFVVESGQVKAMKQRDPSAEFVFPKKQAER